MANYRKQIKKVRAFTLMEVIIVLVISVIIVGLAFSVMNMVSKSCRNISSNYNIKNKEQLLVNQLEVNFNLTNDNYCYESGFKFSSPVDSMEYEFLYPYLITSPSDRNMMKDTLLGNLKNISFYFKGDTISQGRFDAFKIETPAGQYFIRKPNTFKEYFLNEN